LLLIACTMSRRRVLLWDSHIIITVWNKLRFLISLGGSSLYIESVLEKPITRSSRPRFNRTGNMGDVMKESSSLAYSFARAYLAERDPSNDFFSKASIHLHVPEGATPKDGPS